MRVPRALLSSLPYLWIGVLVLIVLSFEGERTPTLAPALPIDRAADRQLAEELERAERLAQERRPVPVSPLRHVRVKDDRPGPGRTITGTAFAVGAGREAGYWVTNHHVVEDCRHDFVLRVRSRLPEGSTLRFDHANDIALVATPLRPEGRLVVAADFPTLGQEAYLYGYPSGEPGIVSGRLLGRARMVASRRDGHLLYWIETARSASNMIGGLNGASGGPMMNAAGEVIGVLAVTEPRRGRFGTVAPEALRAIAPPPGTAAPVTLALPAQTWEARGVELMRRGLVVRTSCRT